MLMLILHADRICQAVRLVSCERKSAVYMTDGHMAAGYTSEHCSCVTAVLHYNLSNFEGVVKGPMKLLVSVASVHEFRGPLVACLATFR